jgi:hypothetical protein
MNGPQLSDSGPHWALTAAARLSRRTGRIIPVLRWGEKLGGSPGSQCFGGYDLIHSRALTAESPPEGAKSKSGKIQL